MPLKCIHVSVNLASWYISNKLPLDLKSIGHVPKPHLFKVNFSLLLAQWLGQWVSHILYGINFLHLDEFFLEIFMN